MTDHSSSSSAVQDYRTNAGMVAPVPFASPTPRLWSAEAWRQLAAQIVEMAHGGGETALSFTTQWAGNLRWARNRFSTSGDIRNNTLTVARTIHGATMAMTVNQLNLPVLRGVVANLEQAIPLYRADALEYQPEPPFQAADYLAPTLWYDATALLTGLQRAQSARSAIAPAEQAGMVSAGYLEVSAFGVAVTNPTRAMALYYPVTEAQYSVTVRDPQGSGSGWAGVNWNDWRRIDVTALSSRALEKCLHSRNPQAVEPGRYTAILEPQAVYDFTTILFSPNVLSWSNALGNPNNPYWMGRGVGTKIGLRLVDPRITVRADPLDPELGFVPFTQTGEPYRPATWFESGTLKTLGYDRHFAVRQGLGRLGLPNSGNFRMDGAGPVATVDEMIASTRRGLLVTRFWNITVIDGPSVLLSGYTRDGVWLVENGKISRPVKNFLFTESPLFALNKVEQVGAPVRVFCPGMAAVVPALKISDFNFSRLSDAV